jgi:hypothetical protein
LIFSGFENAKDQKIAACGSSYAELAGALRKLIYA